ncbi:translation initiation factor IF-2 [Candidatus Azoamicus ciliaticola]|uniref:Translation initiation factor IF-2 n=1 Tax=Candidatus Azoamicus ciliaticola TaxID=2652803 RepID=A0A6J5JVI6_9GAMM|nr:translation initiation factor IF-2 [Candidatus Azoamicus ciliaticola]CAB3976318.1 Translation initiation factor IF-2 [Candidatus Azoamicus ciliaticola]
MSYKEKKINRPPIITVAGHIDHGKTTFLNYIRKIKNPLKEDGGITQHLNAYNVETKYGNMTFIDTPGHSAFNVIRIKSIQNSDIMLLIISIDDGIKQQTIESINIAKEYNIPIIVCINKIDKAELENKKEKIINELSKIGLLQELWGGDTFFTYISAKTGEGIENLIDTINTQAELLDLKSNFDGLANGIILDNKMDNKQGLITSIIIKNGKLKKGDLIKTQTDYGKIKLILNEEKLINEAIPSMYVNIIGLKKNQEIGCTFECFKKEKNTKKQIQPTKIDLTEKKNKYSIEDLIKQMTSNKVKNLNIIIKADVQGSINVLKDTINNIITEKIKINIIKIDIGNPIKSDIDLAITTKSVILCFKTKNSQQINKLIQNNGIILKTFALIHELIFYITERIKDESIEEKKEILIGTAEIKKIFTQDKNVIAGCSIIQGKIKQNSIIKIFRKNTMIHKGSISSIKIFKNQVNEVTQGNECGISIKDYNLIQIHDKIKSYIQE